MMVKICGITNREDALAAIRGGASAIGINFYPKSPRYLAPEAAQELIENLDSKVMKVGVFVNQTAGAILAVAKAVGLDAVQLHGEGCEAPEGMPVWRAVTVLPGFQVADLDAVAADACLLDAPAGAHFGGTGRSFDWSLARGANRPVILAGGLDDTNVRTAIEAARPWGVDACSRLESAPGRKDHRKMAKFLEAARS